MKYVIVKNKDTKYAIEISTIKRIIRHQDITKVPLTSPSNLGVTNIMGEVWPVHDLGYLMDGEYISQNENNKILLLQDKKVAFLIENVDTIKDIEDEDIQETNLGDVTELIAKMGDDIAVILTNNYLQSKTA